MIGHKDEIIRLLREFAELTTLAEGSPQSFRVRAYENAVHGLEGYGDEIADMTESQLVEIRGIGKAIARKIREYIDTGRVESLEKLRADFPAPLVELSRLPGLGPKGVIKLRDELGIESIADLEAAIAAAQVRELAGFGAKSEEKLAKAIERHRQAGDARTPVDLAMRVATKMVAALEALPEVQRIQYCGSLRRLRETIGDVDIVAASTEPQPVMAHFIGLPAVADVIVQGDTKSSILTRTGLQVDLRVVPPESFGAAILYFTGSKAHNIKLRQRALDRGWTLNEYSLSEIDGGAVIAAETEEAIYAALDLAPVPAPMREDTGEVEKSAAGELPEPVRESDLRGDLHLHTTLSGDGRSTLGEMLGALQARGYAYAAITEHAENLPMNGVDRERLLAQREELRARQDDYPDLTLLHGIELNIGPDGELDYDPEFRLGFDWCVAAVHSHFDLDRAAQTKRIIAAMQDPAVNVIGHLSARMIGRREGIGLDIDAVLEAAVETGTAIEINAALPRLDAAAEVCRRARDLDVTFVISTDAHHTAELSRARWGALHAQRGWVDRARVANTWATDEFLAWARRRRAA